MSAKIDISELRVDYVLGAPIYDDKNVKLLGHGVTITEKFLSQLRRRGIRSVQVTDEDLAKLRGWKLSVDGDLEAAPAVMAQPATAQRATESRIDQTRFGRYLAAISQVGRQSRTNMGPLKMIRHAAHLAAGALHAEHYGFGLVFPNNDKMAFFLGAGTSDEGPCQKLLDRRNLKLPVKRSLLGASMASDLPLFVEDLSDDRFSDEFLAELQISSAATVPLHRGTLRAGSMAVFYRHTKTLDDHDLSFLETIANIVTVPAEIDAAELNAESEEIDNLMTSQRYDYHCWQGIVPLEGDKVPLQAPYEEVLCRDISMGGFSFYYPRRPEFSHLAVALGQPPNLKQMKATVVSCSGTEVDGEPCALVSCQFAGPLTSS